MPVTAPRVEVQRNAPIRTWFRIGGRADRLARPASLDELRSCIDLDAGMLVLGDGANLLVHDDGVGALVVALSSPAFCSRSEAVEREDGSVSVRIGAGVRLPRLINETVAAGLGGLERLAGFPATLGGAVRMNAGGAFGEIADVIGSVTGVDRTGRVVVLQRGEIPFGYRCSGLGGSAGSDGSSGTDLIVTEVELRLRPESKRTLDARRREVMAHKAASQPLGAKSAGCCFKNPTLEADVDGVGSAGDRVPAGLLIDRAGCKGLSVGSATVSDVHANFITTRPDGLAADVIRLMERVEDRVLERFGVALQREVVVWRRNDREGERS